MPAKGAEYALLQRKYQFENIIKTVASYRERARGTRKIYTSVREKFVRTTTCKYTQQSRQGPSSNASILPWTTHEPQSDD